MCLFSSKPSTPEIVPAPTPSPPPTPTDTEPKQTAQTKRSKIAAMKYGAMSTIKTSGRGVTGTGADLVTPYASSGKATIG